MKEVKKPFFSKFLESQKIEENKKVKGGVTLKYPSDKDEVYQTQKWPSDGDEI